MRAGTRGFTLVEVTIILLVLVILSGILLPTIERFIDLARYVKAKEDIGMIAAIIEMWKVDNCHRWFQWSSNGGGPTTTLPGVTTTVTSPTTTTTLPLNCNGLAEDSLGRPCPFRLSVSDNRLDLMISDANLTSKPTLDIGIDKWDTQPPGNSGSLTVDTIENQLVIGAPGGSTQYPRPSSLDPSSCGFRGAYISTPIGVDPWGIRYMVNVAFLGPEGTRSLGATMPPGFNQYDVFVLSAGPDQTVSTCFKVDGVMAVNDDMIALVSGGF